MLPFDTEVHPQQLSQRDSVMTLARQLAITGGGTSVSAPLAYLNHKHAQVDLLVLVSDNESWRDTRGNRETATMREWAALKARCPQAQLVCIDLQPVSSSQTVEREDVLHIGGFSDAVFELLANASLPPGQRPRWAERIAAMDL